MWMDGCSRVHRHSKRPPDWKFTPQALGVKTGSALVVAGHSVSSRQLLARAIEYRSVRNSKGATEEMRGQYRPFAERNVMESLPDLRPRLYPCGLMSAARSASPHFSASSAISLPRSAGDPAGTVPPTSAS